MAAEESVALNIMEHRLFCLKFILFITEITGLNFIVCLNESNTMFLSVAQWVTFGIRLYMFCSAEWWRPHTPHLSDFRRERLPSTSQLCSVSQGLPQLTKCDHHTRTSLLTNITTAVTGALSHSSISSTSGSTIIIMYTLVSEGGGGCITGVWGVWHIFLNDLYLEALIFNRRRPYK